MNTYKDYYETLTDSEREAFDIALKSEGGRVSFNFDNRCDSFHQFIDKSLTWASTPQGQEYWYDLSKEKRYTARERRLVRLYVDNEPEGQKTEIELCSAKAIMHPYYDINGEPRYVNQSALGTLDYFVEDGSRDGLPVLAMRSDRYAVISENSVGRAVLNYRRKWDDNFSEQASLIPIPERITHFNYCKERDTDKVFLKDAQTALRLGYHLHLGELLSFDELESVGKKAVRFMDLRYDTSIIIVNEQNPNPAYTLLDEKCTSWVNGKFKIPYAMHTQDIEIAKERNIIKYDYAGALVLSSNCVDVFCGEEIGTLTFYAPEIEDICRINIGGVYLNVDLVYYDGDCYLNQEFAGQNGLRWCSDCEEWYHEDYEDDHDHCYNDEDDEDERDRNNPRFGYHSQSHLDKSKGSKFKVGFEIEKECSQGCTHSHYSILDASGWVKERDGSLDDYNGYELVSSTYNLFTDEFINQAKELENKFPMLINGNASKNCGGHIHFSKADTLGADLLESICGYLPTLYAIYQHRIGKSYCEVKEKEQMKQSDNKYQAVRVMRNRIEFRIFPAVKNLSTLEWRLGLIRIMAKNPSSNPIEIANKLTDSRTELHKHFAKIFSKSVIMQRASKAIELAQKFDKNYYNIDLRINLDKIKAKESKAIRQEAGKKKRQAVTA